MLFQLNQVEECALSLMEEIPDSFFNNIEANAVYGFNLFPDWFEIERGSQTNGLYAEGLMLFNLIKTSGRQAEIVQWYTEYQNVLAHCQDVTTTINYLSDISQELHTAASNFFSSLYSSFDSIWFKNYSNFTVREYISQFKRLNNVFLCPTCGSETITHGENEARSALDHWFSKAKYPLLGVHLNNLIPMGDGCNNPPRKGENELIYADNTRTQRQQFYYPFFYEGDVTVTFLCINEPTTIEGDLGNWLFEFTGVNAAHQTLVDRWSSFFKISERWIEDILEIYILSWTDEAADMIRELNSDINIHADYHKAIKTLQASKKRFTINPHNRVHWHFLNFILDGASAGLFEGYRAIIRENLNNE